MKHRIKLTVIESSCRSGIHKAGEEYSVDDRCPPICHELWNNIYPMLYALGSGGELESGEGYAKSFIARCPDGGRVVVKCETED